MKISKIDKKADKVVCNIEIEHDIWAAAIKREQTRLAKNVQLPGFRAGKVPLDRALKAVDMHKVLIDAANKVINESVLKLEQEPQLKTLDVEIFPTPSVDIHKEFDEQHFGFDVIYWLMPQVEIEGYKNFKIDLVEPTVNDKEVEAELTNLLAREKMLTAKPNKTIAKGDQATFDFTGYLDGVEFPNGKAEKYQLEIGSGNFIPGFEEQMIGFKVGDEKDISVTFPKEYHAKEMAGKLVTFKIKVHEVHAVSTPEVNEAFIKSLKLPDANVKTVAQLKDFLKNNIAQYKKQQSFESNMIAINQAIFSHAKYPTIPQIIIDNEKQNIQEQVNQRMSQMKMKFEDFLKMSGKTQAEFDKELSEQAKQSVVITRAVEAIIKKEKIAIDNKALDERYAELAKNYHKDLAEIKKLVDPEVLKDNMLHQKAIDAIIEWNTKKTKK